VGAAAIDVELPAHGACSWGVEELIGHFVDASWAYRFGPPAQDLIAVTLERSCTGATPEVLSQAFRFPAQRPLEQLSAEDLGLRATLRRSAGGASELRLASARFAYGVRIHGPRWELGDDAVSIEPGQGRTVAVRLPDAEAAAGAHVTALNLRGTVQVQVEAAG
jgi:beta-mannosidase